MIRPRWKFQDLTWFDYEPPSTTVCICDRCGSVCRPLSIPAWYQCCGQGWGYYRGYYKPLPADFWQRFRYGDVVPKRYRPEDEPNDEPEIEEESAA
jgi:hypothetical protein